MRKVTILFQILLLGSMATLQACASGTEEDLPAFNPELPGWQAVKIEKGSAVVSRVKIRLFQVFYKNGATLEHNTLQMLNDNIMAPTLELYAGPGARFQVKSAGANGRILVSIIRSDSALSLFRTTTEKQEAIDRHLLTSFRVKSSAVPLPDLPGDTGARYTFRGYLNLELSDFPGNQGQVEFIVSRGLERLIGEFFPGNTASGKTGKVFLVDYRFTSVSTDRIGIYCKLVADFQ